MKKSKLDGIIRASLNAIEEDARDRGTYFHKSDIIKEVMSHRQLVSVITDLETRYGGWHFGTIVEAYIKERISSALQQTTDAHGLRLFESYSGGETERRWQPLRGMTAKVLRVVIAERETLEGQIHAQVVKYRALLEELQKYGNDKTTVDKVYKNVMGRQAKSA